MEGHELEVFRGGKDTLARYHPHLLFECERRHRGSGRVEDVFEFLQRLGYRGWCLGPRGRFEIAQFDPDRHQANRGGRKYVHNFLFTAA